MMRLIKEAELILCLINRIMNEQPMEFVPTDLDWSKFRYITDLHMISNLPAYRIDAFIDMPDELKTYYSQQKSSSILREAVQEITVTSLLKKFEYKGIKCMPLKGFVTKRLYPMPDMRSMSDTDILIDCDDIDRLRIIMREEGFMFDHESIHELVYRNDKLVIELHKSIVPACNDDSYLYFGNGWRFAKKRSNSDFIYELSPEDAYIHCVEHLARHYLGGGAGIKNVMDVYMFNKFGLDYKYVANAMKQLGLYKFNQKISTLADIWFSTDPQNDYDKDTYDMALYIINNGAFGTVKSSAITNVFKTAESEDYSKARRKIYLKWLFLKRSDLENQYPLLRKYVWLYPFYSIVRWKDILMYRKDNIKSRLYVRNIMDEDVKSFSEHCKNIGLKKTL